MQMKSIQQALNQGKTKNHTEYIKQKHIHLLFHRFGHRKNSNLIKRIRNEGTDTLSQKQNNEKGWQNARVINSTAKAERQKSRRITDKPPRSATQREIQNIWIFENENSVTNGKKWKMNSEFWSRKTQK